MQDSGKDHPGPSLFIRLPCALKAVLRKIVQKILNFIAFNSRHHHRTLFLRYPDDVRTKPPEGGIPKVGRDQRIGFFYVFDPDIRDFDSMFKAV